VRSGKANGADLRPLGLQLCILGGGGGSGEARRCDGVSRATRTAAWEKGKKRKGEVTMTSGTRLAGRKKMNAMENK